MSYRDYGPIPSRWLKCPRKASGLVAGKFLAFKTPLGPQFNDKVPEENRFTPSMLFVYMKSLKVKLGLWVDLTNTTRFYDKTEIENMDCKYVKMQCRGHGETPSLDQTKLFIQLVTKFLSQNPLEVIGVHCTHGFNRTGFLLVCYMVEQLDCSVEAAITEFAKMRPPGIYKQDYLEELYRRYDDVEYTPAAPLRPEWCDEEEEDYDDCTPSNSQSSSSQNTADGSTTKQINFLVDYMSEITGPFGGEGVHAEWTKLKELLATKGPNRSVDQWKNTWRDLIQNAKEEGVRARLTCNQTGSAMPLPEISERGLKILTTLGPEYVMTISNEETGIEKPSDEMVVEPHEPSPNSEPQPQRRARRRKTDRPMARILASLKKQNALLKERITERRIRNLLMMRYIKGHLRGPVHRLSFGQSSRPNVDKIQNYL